MCGCWLNGVALECVDKVKKETRFHWLQVEEARAVYTMDNGLCWRTSLQFLLTQTLHVPRDRESRISWRFTGIENSFAMNQAKRGIRSSVFVSWDYLSKVNTFFFCRLNGMFCHITIAIYIDFDLFSCSNS